MRYTEYHNGVAVIRDKGDIKDAMAKLARLEDLEADGRLAAVTARTEPDGGFRVLTAQELSELLNLPE